MACTIKKVKSGYYSQFYITVTKGDITTESPTTAIPPTIIFNDKGFKIQTLADLEKGIKKHNYFAGSKDFTQDRINNLTVSQYTKHFSSYPIIEREVINGKWENHKVSEFLARSYVLLEPTQEYQEKLAKMPFVEAGEEKAKLLVKLRPYIEQKLEHKLDFYSIPKRDISQRVYLADKNGTAFIAKLLSFGFHNAIPCNRIVREAGSLRQAERFANPYQPVKVHSVIEPYTTFLKVAIVKTSQSMLDGGDLFPSGQKKVGSVLQTIKLLPDVEDLNQPDLVYRPNQAGLDVWRQELISYDEVNEGTGPCRLVLPGGVKICTSPSPIQPHYQDEPIDLLLDFTTLTAKGALALFAMVNEDSFSSIWDYAQVLEVFKSRKLQEFKYGSKTLTGYICLIPVMRPRQRHMEICKPRNDISLDIVSHAILNQRMVTSSFVENEYQSLRKFRNSLANEISQITG